MGASGKAATARISFCSGAKSYKVGGIFSFFSLQKWSLARTCGGENDPYMGSRRGRKWRFSDHPSIGVEAASFVFARRSEHRGKEKDPTAGKQRERDRVREGSRIAACQLLENGEFQRFAGTRVALVGVAVMCRGLVSALAEAFSTTPADDYSECIETAWFPKFRFLLFLPCAPWFQRTRVLGPQRLESRWEAE